MEPPSTPKTWRAISGWSAAARYRASSRNESGASRAVLRVSSNPLAVRASRLLLIAGECLVHRLMPSQGLVDGVGEQVGGEEGIGHAHASARVFVVAGVAGQRPPGPGRCPVVIRQVTGAGEGCFPVPGCGRLTQSRDEFQGGMEAAFYVAAHLVEVLPGPGDVDAGQVVVGGPGQDQLAGAGVERCTQAADPAPVGVVNGRQRGVLPVGAGADPPGDARMHAVRTDDDRGPQRGSGRPGDGGPAHPWPCRQTRSPHRPRSVRSGRRRTRRPPRPGVRRGRSAAGSRCRPRLPPPARCRTSAPGRGRR